MRMAGFLPISRDPNRRRCFPGEWGRGVSYTASQGCQLPDGAPEALSWILTWPCLILETDVSCVQIQKEAEDFRPRDDS